MDYEEREYMGEDNSDEDSADLYYSRMSAKRKKRKQRKLTALIVGISAALLICTAVVMVLKDTFNVITPSGEELGTVKEESVQMVAEPEYRPEPTAPVDNPEIPETPVIDSLEPEAPEPTLTGLDSNSVSSPVSYEYVLENSAIEIAEAEKQEVFRFRKSLLSGEDAEYYSEICNAVRGQKPSLSFTTSMNVKRLMELAEYVYYDYPEYFWFEGHSNIEYYEIGDSKKGDMYFEYRYSASERNEKEKRLKAATSAIIGQLSGKSDYEKVKGVYEYIINNTRYTETVSDQSCYSVLTEGCGICAGYTSAFGYILNNLGIDNIYVSGVSKGENHAWNLVNVESDWYQVDCTWGDPIMKDNSEVLSYDYLLLTDSEMKIDHSPDDDTVYPTCNSVEYNYYRREGLSLERYSFEAVKEIAKRCHDSNRNIIIKGANSSVYEETVDNLLEGNAEEVFRLFAEIGLSDKKSVNYRLDPDHRIIEISI